MSERRGTTDERLDTAKVGCVWFATLPDGRIQITVEHGRGCSGATHNHTVTRPDGFLAALQEHQDEALVRREPLSAQGVNIQSMRAAREAFGSTEHQLTEDTP